MENDDVNNNIPEIEELIEKYEKKILQGLALSEQTEQESPSEYTAFLMRGVVVLLSYDVFKIAVRKILEERSFLSKEEVDSEIKRYWLRIEEKTVSLDKVFEEENLKMLEFFQRYYRELQKKCDKNIEIEKKYKRVKSLLLKKGYEERIKEIETQIGAEVRAESEIKKG